MTWLDTLIEIVEETIDVGGIEGNAADVARDCIRELRKASSPPQKIGVVKIGRDIIDGSPYHRSFFIEEENQQGDDDYSDTPLTDMYNAWLYKRDLDETLNILNAKDGPTDRLLGYDIFHEEASKKLRNCNGTGREIIVTDDPSEEDVDSIDVSR